MKTGLIKEEVDEMPEKQFKLAYKFDTDKIEKVCEEEGYFKIVYGVTTSPSVRSQKGINGMKNTQQPKKNVIKYTKEEALKEIAQEEAAEKIIKDNIQLAQSPGGSENGERTRKWDWIVMHTWITHMNYTLDRKDVTDIMGR